MARLRLLLTGSIIFAVGIVLDLVRGPALRFDIIMAVGIIVLIMGLFIK